MAQSTIITTLRVGFAIIGIMIGTHLDILSTGESHTLAMSGDSSRDKAYIYICREAKLDTDASGMGCSGKGISR